jgi:hypothetical protein
MTNRMTHEDSINVVCLAKGAERYIILHDDAHLCDVAAVLRDWAADDSLSFTVTDAGMLCRKMHEESCEGK